MQISSVQNLANINRFLIFTNLIQTNLTTKIFGHEIEYFTFTDSTNEDVWDALADDIDEGFLVITDHQKNGRGRRGNRWLSEPGSSLTFSFLIKPKLPLEKIGLLSLLTGVAVVEGISQFAQLDCKLKWPNDIILNNKKVGGILAESKLIDNEIYVVMGVGLNVNEQELPPEISPFSSTLRCEKESPIQREPLLAFILNAFESMYNNKDSEWINAWNSHCIHLNSDVKFHHGNDTIQGTFLEIDNMGQASLNINGSVQKFSSGIIELS
ncbi:MAG: biotin--[acetyl-CoA-carboxylase] ligase [Candidatus Marinimicrobia bacterium]|nr:biotin--[acetyl-CoA-carboxylase] ligase [Candidatus Neomarinimicrobiota bacterium]